MKSILFLCLMGVPLGLSKTNYGPFECNFPYGPSRPCPQNREVFDVMFQWKILDFEFDSPQQRQMYLDSGEYVQENVSPLGVARWRDRLFITTPRWRTGIPASLSVIPLDSPYENPLLEPYPSIDFHSTVTNPDCSKLISVFRVFVDECNRLWATDTGNVESLTNFIQICPPKIVVFDLNTDTVLVSYEIPPEQVKVDGMHSNIIVDVPNGRCANAFAYVTDVYRYAIIVYSLAEGRSWRTTSMLYYPTPAASDYNIDGMNFQWDDGVFGLSLGPQAPNGDRTLFFHPLSSFTEFMVNTGTLKNESIWLNGGTSPKSFRPIGTRGKGGQSITVGISKGGVQVYTLAQRASIGCWDIRKPYTIANQGVVEMDEIEINLASDLKIDWEDPQNIWVISNNLPTFMYSTLDYNKVNFRVLTSTVAKAVAGTICDPRTKANLMLHPEDKCPL